MADAMTLAAVLALASQCAPSLDQNLIAGIAKHEFGLNPAGPARQHDLAELRAGDCERGSGSRSRSHPRPGSQRRPWVDADQQSQSGLFGFAGVGSVRRLPLHKSCGDAISCNLLLQHGLTDARTGPLYWPVVAARMRVHAKHDRLDPTGEGAGNHDGFRACASRANAGVRCPIVGCLGPASLP